MTIRRFEPMTKDRVAIYGGLCLLSTVVTVAAIVHNRGHLPVGAWVALISSWSAFHAITTILFALRLYWASQIAGYTSQGVALVVPHSERARIEAIPDWQRQIEEVLDYVIGFWSTVYPDQGARIREFFNGGSLYISPKLLEPHGVWEGGKLVERAVGLASGNVMAIWWPPGEAMAKVFARTKHEGTHVVLTAVGEPQDRQHEIMASKGFAW